MNRPDDPTADEGADENLSDDKSAKGSESGELTGPGPHGDQEEDPDT